jgi:hypothetical protein
MPGGVIGDMLAARWEDMGETALRGLCQLSIHNKYLPCRSFHSSLSFSSPFSLYIRSFTRTIPLPFIFTSSYH